MDLLENSNPQVFQKSGDRLINPDDEDDAIYDEIDNREIFDAIKAIKGIVQLRLQKSFTRLFPQIQSIRYH